VHFYKKETSLSTEFQELGSSVEAAATQVTDVSRPITVAIHIQRLVEREATEGD
jgi:hypothetical protein